MPSLAPTYSVGRTVLHRRLRGPVEVGQGHVVTEGEARFGDVQRDRVHGIPQREEPVAVDAGLLELGLAAQEVDHVGAAVRNRQLSGGVQQRALRHGGHRVALVVEPGPLRGVEVAVVEQLRAVGHVVPAQIDGAAVGIRANLGLQLVLGRPENARQHGAVVRIDELRDDFPVPLHRRVGRLEDAPIRRGDVRGRGRRRCARGTAFVEVGERRVQTVLHGPGVVGVEELAAAVDRRMPQVVQIPRLSVAGHRPVAGPCWSRSRRPKRPCARCRSLLSHPATRSPGASPSGPRPCPGRRSPCAASWPCPSRWSARCSPTRRCRALRSRRSCAGPSDRSTERRRPACPSCCC